MSESLSLSEEQNLHESPNSAVLLPMHLLSHYLQILAMKINSGEHVNGLERALVHEKSKSEYHIACVE
jgi:hypothetical protein